MCSKGSSTVSQKKSSSTVSKKKVLVLTILKYCISEHVVQAVFTWRPPVMHAARPLFLGNRVGLGLQPHREGFKSA
jgi:hypothetical protein